MALLAGLGGSNRVFIGTPSPVKIESNDRLSGPKAIYESLIILLLTDARVNQPTFITTGFCSDKLCQCSVNIYVADNLIFDRLFHESIRQSPHKRESMTTFEIHIFS